MVRSSDSKTVAKVGQERPLIYIIMRSFFSGVVGRCIFFCNRQPAEARHRDEDKLHVGADRNILAVSGSPDCRHWAPCGSEDAREKT